MVAAPDILATTAADVGEIGSAITDAKANAAGPTSGLIAAAQDEVSQAIAKLFGGYGQQYQAALTKAAAFHDDFARAPGGGGQHLRASRVQRRGVPHRRDIQRGQHSKYASTVTGFANPSAQQVVALIMGGTWNP